MDNLSCGNMSPSFQVEDALAAALSSALREDVFRIRFRGSRSAFRGKPISDRHQPGTVIAIIPES